MNYSAYFTDGPIELRMTGDVIHCAVGPPTVNGKRVMALTIFFPLKYRNHGWIGRHTRLVFRIRKRGIEWKSANTLINHIVIVYFSFSRFVLTLSLMPLEKDLYKSWCLLHCVCMLVHCYCFDCKTTGITLCLPFHCKLQVLLSVWMCREFVCMLVHCYCFHCKNYRLHTVFAFPL